MATHINLIFHISYEEKHKEQSMKSTTNYADSSLTESQIRKGTSRREVKFFRKVDFSSIEGFQPQISTSSSHFPSHMTLFAFESHH